MKTKATNTFYGQNAVSYVKIGFCKELTLYSRMGKRAI